MMNPRYVDQPHPNSDQTSYPSYERQRHRLPGYDRLEASHAGQHSAYPLRGSYSENTTPRLGFNASPENMLRRKTPHGTLTGAYESNAHDSQVSKHVLLPRNDGMQGFAQYPQIDSMLHQAPPHFHHSHQFYGQTVPSVLQPSFQHLGPTAPGLVGQGPYGPYWHDGTYEPYRPAAIRDPRFYNQTDSRWGADVGYGRMSSWQTEHPALVYPASGSRSASWQANGSAYHNTVQANVAPAYSHGQLFVPLMKVLHLLTFTDITPSTNLIPDFGPSPANAQQREECFNWALQAYRDLLGYIQHLRRQNQHRLQHKPSFYPKPPTLSGTPFPTPSAGTPSSARPHQGSGVRIDGQSSASGAQSNDFSNSTPNHDSNNVSNNRRSWPHLIRRSSEGAQTIRRSSGAAISPIIHSIPQDHSPETRAINALAAISKLCEETDWQWIDGMHLGGCLIFGLGKYEKASRWYTKVLELDPR